MYTLTSAGSPSDPDASLMLPPAVSAKEMAQKCFKGFPELVPPMVALMILRAGGVKAAGVSTSAARLDAAEHRIRLADRRRASVKCN